jgi:PAS domain S-box-containing protein
MKRIQVLLIAGSFIGFVIVFDPMYQLAAGVVGVISFVPAALAAYFWGLRGGLLVGGISLLLDIILFTAKDPTSGLLRGQTLFGGAGILVMVVGISRLRDLLGKIQRQADELERVRDGLELRVQARTRDLEETNLALRASEEKFRRLTHAASDGIIFSNQVGTILFFNHAAEKMFGYRAEDIIGKSVEGLVPASLRETWRAGMRRAQTRELVGETRLQQVEGLRQDGSQFPIEISISQVVLGSEIVYTASLRDITVRKRAEQLSAAFTLLGQQLNAATSLADAAEIIVQVADQLLGWDACYVSLHQPDKNLLTVVLRMDVINGQRTRLTLDTRETQPTLLLSQVLQGQGCLLNEDGDPTLIATLENFGDVERPSASRMFVPIRIGTQTTGILSIQSYTPNLYAPESLATLQALADYCGGAFERIRSGVMTRASLREKEVLLKEIHHRVKNNLQVVSSLLNLQAHRISDAAGREMFRDSQNRVRSMALIHEKLYQSSNLATIDFGEYIRNLCTFLWRSYGAKATLIALEVQVESVALGIDQAVPCSLILHELLSNALKHAFPGGRPGQITVQLTHCENNRLELIVGDDGIGISVDVIPANATSLGFELVNTLVNQLNGELWLEREHGTTFHFRFTRDGV